MACTLSVFYNIVKEKTTVMAYPFVVTIATGTILRLLLCKSVIAQWLADKNEIATPLTSWKRVTEGLSLYNAGISPYAGDIFHEMPLMLRLLLFLNKLFGSYIYLLFILLDILVALVLERIAYYTGRHLLKEQKRNVKSFATDIDSLILKASQLQWSRLYVVAAYLFNPYTIATCVAQSTAIFNTLAIVLAMLLTLKGNRAGTCLSIAVAAYISMYPIMLVVPAAIFIAKKESSSDTWASSLTYSIILQIIVCTTFALGFLLYFSFILEGSWMFIYSTYGFTLTVPDLTPNIGIFWYFFTEMFEHFRVFFIWVFQINAFIYTVPLAIRLKEHPLFLMYVLLALMAIFKSYPSYADAALYLSLLPLWMHTFSYMRNTFVVTCMLVACAVLSPIQWHLWIYAGSANANFYFAITLVYATAQVFLITDLMYAYLRREYDLVAGLKPMLNGQPAQVTLT